MRQQRRAGLWHQSNFLTFWSSETISQFGSQITALALPFAAAINLGATPGQMGVLSAVEVSPFLLFGLLAGVWVDRLKRGPILRWSNLGRGLLLTTIPLASWLGWLSMSQLYLVAFLVGVLTLFFDVAYQSYLPSLVSHDHLVEGNSKLEVSRSLAAVAGPGLAGVLVQAVSAPAAILLDAVSFFVSASMLGLVRVEEPQPASSANRNIRQEIAEGLGVVVHSPVLRSMVASTASFNLFSYIWGTVFLLFMTRQLGLDALQVGLVFGLGSIGALVGALLVSRVTAFFGLGRALILAQLFGGMGLLIIPFASSAQPLALIMLATAMLLTTMGGMIFNINALSLRQAITPDRLLGRMNASIRFLVWGTMPFGSLIGGFLGDLLGLQATVTIGVIGCALSFLWLFLSPLRRLHAQPTSSAEVLEVGV